MYSKFVLVFAIGIVLSRTPIQAQMPGVYQLTICASQCTESDSGLVRGSLVLFRDPIHIDTIANLAYTPLSRDLYLVRHAKSVNACFALRRIQSRVNGQELYAGIIGRSFTTWTSVDGATHVALYGSPDASFMLVGIGAHERHTYSGTGHQSNWNGETGPLTFFRAVRVGDPDPAACLSH
ncbi:hypothetical protein [Gemmatimonas aurantiaca]|uniref:hypothetical protein n=1 Tax=Gemmatimonas aurantiaca TaxID=173480 RepID=UPI00301BDC07